MTEFGWIDKDEESYLYEPAKEYESFIESSYDEKMGHIQSIPNGLTFESSINPITFAEIDTGLDDVLNARLYDPTNMQIVTKPTMEEELSKIHEELANQNQDNNELRKERRSLQKESKKQQEEIEKLKKSNLRYKDRLKKSKAKNKFDNNSMQLEIDDLQLRMNGAEDVLDIKKDGI
jgi:predicted nuclease with TOPRIM domain